MMSANNSQMVQKILCVEMGEKKDRKGKTERQRENMGQNINNWHI